MGDKKDDKGVVQKISDGIRFAPDAVFDSIGDSQDTNESLMGNNDESGLGNIHKSFQDYVAEQPKTVADGVFKGLLSIGSGVFQGITGVVTEPIREVQKKGAIGVVTGVGKGITGLVTKPLAGVFDMGVKTTQGVINTPGTISRGMGNLFDSTPAPPEYPIFGVKHEVSIQNAEKMKIVHPTISIINYIRKNGLETHGIFREPGNVLLIKQICEDYDYSRVVKLEEFEVRELSGVLKNYLRSLPEPLLSFDLYNQFLNVLKSSTALTERDAHLYRALIKSLPSSDRLLLQSLLALLHDISKKSDINKMTAPNLSIVFGPSILRPQDANAASELFDMPDVTKVVNFLIQNHVNLF